MLFTKYRLLKLVASMQLLWTYVKKYAIKFTNIGILDGNVGCTFIMKNFIKTLWRCGVVVITTDQLYSTNPELRFCVGLNPARGVWVIRDGDGEDLWQWFRLETRLNAFRRSTIPQKQFIIIKWDCFSNLPVCHILEKSYQILFKSICAFLLLSS